MYARGKMFDDDEVKEEDFFEILKRGTKILTFQIKSKPSPLKVRCSYLFLTSSLARLCADFKVPGHLAKSSFDHQKIFDWNSAEEHREEVVDYNIRDVTALEFIYTSFAKALFEICPINMSASISLASQAFEMWKMMEPKEIIENIRLPDSLEHYNIFKSMYHGGRVLPTISAYDSKLWTVGGADPHSEVPAYVKDTWEFEGDVNEEHMEDLLKMVDVVSLYPSVMRRFKYPVGNYSYSVISGAERVREALLIQTTVSMGKYEHYGHDSNSNSSSSSSNFDEEEVFVHREELDRYAKMKEYMFRSCFKVNILTTKPILIAFLIRKNDDTGSPEQSLEDLNDYWVTGIELFEAIRIGYTLTMVHEVISWAKVEPVFGTYISKLFKVKEDNKKDKTSALYLAAKVGVRSFALKESGM